MNVYESDLIHLKNIGAASVNILRAVGIHNADDLKSVGAVETYLRIKNRGISVSKVMLYALQGALDDTHWSDLSAQEKAQLIDAASNQAMLEEPRSVANS